MVVAVFKTATPMARQEMTYLETRDRGTTFGFAGNDTITGGAGQDSVHGGDGNDTIRTGAGNDYVHGGLGDDFIDGGAGNDWLNYGNDFGLANGIAVGAGATSGVTVNLNITTAQNTGGAGIDTIIGFENVAGTEFNDVLTGLANQSSTIFAFGGNDRVTGGSASDDLWGGNGNDTIDGGGGTDFLHGNAGNDTIRGGDGGDFIWADFRDLTTIVGNDVIDGGLGIDSLYYEDAASSLRLDLNILTAQSTGGGGIETITNVENIYSSQFADVITGNAAANVLIGGSGADVIKGMGGNDLIQVGVGGTADGGDGNDQIWEATFGFGGNGNDTMISGYGVQNMTGGAGADTFLFDVTTAGYNSYTAPDQMDVITDYSRAQGDKIDLHNYGLGTTNVIGYANYTSFVGLSQIKFVNHGTYQTIEADLSGDRVSDFAIRINGTAPLAASDFILV